MDDGCFLIPNVAQPKPHKIMEKKIKHILLVDDSKSTNFFNKIIIEKMGLAEKVSIAENGAEALRYFNYDLKDSEKPDLIFLDINMPIMNGIEFLDHYNRLNYEKKASVIMMIGSELLSDDQEKLRQYDFIIAKSEKMLTKGTLTKILEKFENINQVEKIAAKVF